MLTDCKKTIFLYFNYEATIRHYSVFLATGAAEKLLISENRYLSGFQGHVGGIGGSGVQSEYFIFSANGIPAKRVTTLSTLSQHHKLY